MGQGNGSTTRSPNPAPAWSRAAILHAASQASSEFLPPPSQRPTSFYLPEKAGR